MRPHPFLVLALVGALMGFAFASVSTYDFQQHLDRQVHNVHCSFVPGLEGEETGGSDCEVTLMSPYSSVMRSSIWGGIPISLPAMSVFAYLLFIGVELMLGRRQRDSRATGYYALAALLPALTSVVMGYISLGELDAACKLCIGIYISSAITLTGALGLWWSARSGGASSGLATDLSDPEWAADEGGEDASIDLEPDPVDFDGWGSPDPNKGPVSFAMLGLAFVLGIVFVAVPVGAYVVSAPDHSRFIGTCGSIEEPPPARLLVEMGPQHGAPALEVFDPLCPACRGFEEHLEKTPYYDKLARKAVLFPLDDECNWMLGDAVHPGACAVSEAILCAGDGADQVIDWAFANQERIRKAAESDDEAARKLVSQQFPGLSSCVGSPKAKARLNQSLRWAVDNKIKILTPQVYVDGVRLCDEDVDLGLEFALSEMLEHHRQGTLHPSLDSE